MRSRLSTFGRIIHLTGAMKTYENGDGVGFVWRWYHPLSWILCPLVVIASVLFIGIPETYSTRHQLGLRMDPWFIEHPEQLKWTKNP